MLLRGNSARNKALWTGDLYRAGDCDAKRLAFRWLGAMASVNSRKGGFGRHRSAHLLYRIEGASYDHLS